MGPSKPPNLGDCAIEPLKPLVVPLVFNGWRMKLHSFIGFGHPSNPSSGVACGGAVAQWLTDLQVQTTSAAAMNSSARYNRLTLLLL